MKPWRRTVPILFFAVLATLGQAHAQSSREDDTRELQRLETVWNDAHERGDAGALEALWADDIEVVVPRMPVLMKSDLENVVHSGRMKFKTYRTSDLRFRIYGNVAVITGRLQRLRSVDGREVSDNWRFTKVYTRESQTWQVVSFHASEAAQP